MANPAPEYAKRRIDQINAAVQSRDGDTAATVIRLIIADGFPDFADRVLNSLIEQGLDNMVTQAGGQR